MYFVVKVTSGQERIVANMLQNKASKDSPNVYSIMVVEGMRGYIIIEAADELACREFVSKEHNVRGVLSKPLSQEEIDKLVSMPSKAQDIQRDDIVEFNAGPFKGYKAKVLKIDESKNDMTVELMDVVVPIPITTKINTAKVIQKAKNVEE
ncbi:MAG: transcription elongation factor Spt5 [Candidatus Marsarchaeota archaeon]|nr:transcription elongation factor Spt5 [Candidatus Marsarchaeota archaeon]MCL5102354.1 transcription elongation factor Spt5 [Candidatus Marsarchaeota archaeon]